MEAKIHRMMDSCVPFGCVNCEASVFIEFSKKKKKHEICNKTENEPNGQRNHVAAETVELTEYNKTNNSISNDIPHSVHCLPLCSV